MFAACAEKLKHNNLTDDPPPRNLQPDGRITADAIISGEIGAILDDICLPLSERRT